MHLQNFIKPFQLLASISLLLFFTSCGDDDSGDNGMNQETPTFTFDGNGYTIDGGEVYDYGAVNYVDAGDASHYNYDFVVYDGTVDVQNQTFDGSFFVYAELLSSGTGSFQPGTFTFVLPQEASEVAGMNYFAIADLAFDANQNNSVEDAEDQYFIAFGGTIEVTDNGNNNFTLTYDLDIVQFDLANENFVEGSETSLEFSVTTDFAYFDESQAARLETARRVFRKRR